MSRIKTAALSALLLSTALISGAGWRAQDTTSRKKESPPASAGQVRIPNRPSAALFKGQQGKQKTEIHFDAASGMVTLKLLVQDPNGFFIPNIRRENFVVYENGIRQQNANVEIEHAPVALAVAFEHGGHYPGVNKSVIEQVSREARQLLDVLGREDQIAIWRYGDKAEQLMGFSQDHRATRSMFITLEPPAVSEVNLYDALISILPEIRQVNGRRGLLLLSSGLDTFSKATFDNVLNAVRSSETPIYAISLVPALRTAVELQGSASPLARFDWKRAENELLAIARTSGGRLYSPETTIDLSAIYDDIFENLKVRYVVTYKSSIDPHSREPRMVRVELVNPKTGAPLQIVDASGKTIRANVIFEDTFTPSVVTGP